MYVPEHVATSFQWQYGGRSVYVCGSFTGWQEMVPLTLNPHTNIFHVVINVPPGTWHFFFLGVFVDVYIFYFPSGGVYLFLFLFPCGVTA